MNGMVIESVGFPGEGWPLSGRFSLRAGRQDRQSVANRSGKDQAREMENCGILPKVKEQ